MAAVTTLLRWPDRSQARSYIDGFRILDDIDTTGVFREIRQTEEAREPFFGAAAEAALEELRSTRPPKEAGKILEATKEE